MGWPGQDGRRQAPGWWRAGRLAGLRFGAPVLGLLTDLVVTRTIGVDGLGRFAAIMSIGATVAIAATLGLPGPVHRELVLADGPVGRSRLTFSTLWVVVAATGAVALIMVAGSMLGFVSTGWLPPEVADRPVLFGAGIVGGLALQSMAVAVARGHDRLTLATLAELVGAKVGLLVGLGLALLLVDPLTLTTVLVVAVVAGFVPIVGVLVWLTVGDALRPTRPSLKIARGLAAGSRAMLGQQIVFTIAASTALWVLDRSVGSAEAGVFHLLSRLAALASIVAIVVQFIYANQIAQAHSRNDLASVEPKLRRAVGLATGAAVVIAAVVIAAHRPVLDFLTGGDGIDSGRMGVLVALCVLVVGHLVQVATGPSGYTLIMGRQEIAVFVTTTISALVAVVVAVVAVPRWGLVGAAAATCSGQVTNNLANLVVARSLVGLTTSARPGRRGRTGG